MEDLEFTEAAGDLGFNVESEGCWVGSNSVGRLGSKGVSPRIGPFSDCGVAAVFEKIGGSDASGSVCAVCPIPGVTSGVKKAAVLGESPAVGSECVELLALG